MTELGSIQVRNKITVSVTGDLSMNGTTKKITLKAD